MNVVWKAFVNKETFVACQCVPVSFKLTISHSSGCRVMLLSWTRPSPHWSHCLGAKLLKSASDWDVYVRGNHQQDVSFSSFPVLKNLCWKQKRVHGKGGECEKYFAVLENLNKPTDSGTGVSIFNFPCMKRGVSTWLKILHPYKIQSFHLGALGSLSAWL